MKTVFVNTIEPLSQRSILNGGGAEAFSLCGGNTGNVCFADAVKEQLLYAEEISCYKIGAYEGKAVFVLPASNWINIDGHVLRNIFLPLETKNVQLVVLGLGIQLELSDNIGEFIAELSKNKDTIKALKILSEHSKYIGVRGSVTGECLDRIGIHNWKIIGCPSFYEPYRKYGKLKMRERALDHIVINYTPGKHGENRILEYGVKNEVDIILQSMKDMPLTLWENRPIEERHLFAKFPGELNVSTDDVYAWLKTFGHMFYTRKAWSEFLIRNETSFVVGSRFHGNMMAFSNGIPALWIVHDMRTKELVDAMKLPYIGYKDILEAPVNEMIYKCIYDDEFYHMYAVMGKAYVDFLEQCGVEHRFI